LEQINASLPPRANFHVILFKKFKLYDQGTPNSQKTDRQTDRQNERLTTA